MLTWRIRGSGLASGMGARSSSPLSCGEALNREERMDMRGGGSLSRGNTGSVLCWEIIIIIIFVGVGWVG